MRYLFRQRSLLYWCRITLSLFSSSRQRRPWQVYPVFRMAGGKKSANPHSELWHHVNAIQNRCCAAVSVIPGYKHRNFVGLRRLHTSKRSTRSNGGIEISQPPLCMSTPMVITSRSFVGGTVAGSSSGRNVWQYFHISRIGLTSGSRWLRNRNVNHAATAYNHNVPPVF